MYSISIFFFGTDQDFKIFQASRPRLLIKTHDNFNPNYGNSTFSSYGFCHEKLRIFLVAIVTSLRPSMKSSKSKCVGGVKVNWETRRFKSAA